MSEGKASRKRRTAVWVILVLATIIAVASSLTVWVKRQALDTKAVTNLSTRILEDDAVRAKLSVYLVDQLFDGTDVSKTLSEKLPASLQPLASPIAGAFRQLSVQTANTLLDRPRVQDLFAKAVHDAHAAFVRLVDGKAPNVTTQGDTVYLDLKPVLTQFAEQLGVGESVVAKLPPDAGQVKLMTKNQLDAIQTAASVLKSISIFLVIAVFGLYALAIYLARGFRRATLRNVGLAFALVGVLLLVVRKIAGNMVVDTIGKGGGSHEAGHHIWLLSTSLLSDVAWACIGYGLVVAIGAILAGPTRPAVWVRRRLAPTFRDHPALVFTAVAVLYLLLVLWAPTRAQTEWISTLILAAGVFVGVEVFRRHTIREFPPEGGSTARPAPA